MSTHKVSNFLSFFFSIQFPGVANAQDGTSTEEQPILMLPPSTNGMMQSNSSYPSVDDMDVESENTQIGRKRLASGLGNLGNTCFMNSTLQCLAHTDPLRRYFLSGEYESDLNRDNPLGTGGELAAQFADLMREMWWLPGKRRNVLGTEGSYSNSSTSAVYPRNFKHCVGKHAEQFMGYDQHDSQEFATYLLDALHEDTNRITKKPYVENPEQGEDETDDIASHNAWGLHLQREDSRVLENFMGQVKSRLECSEETCNRVSTTFDPFMYLSVPIPGASDRTLTVTFIQLDPNQRPRNLSLTVAKAAPMGKVFVKLNEELIKLGVRSENVPLHDFVAADIWSHEVFSWYKNDSEIDRIRDSDITFIYELEPLSEIVEASKNTEEIDENEENLSETRSHPRLKLDLEALTQLNKDDDWQSVLEKHVKHSHTLYSLFNEKRGTIHERMQFHKKLDKFIGLCHKEIEEEEPSLKRTREESDEADKSSDMSISNPEEETIQGLIDRSDASPTFKDVKTKLDVAVLEFCANKMRQMILKLIRKKKDEYKDGILIQVSMKRHHSTYSQGSKFASPIALRIPSTMTVFDLRKLLASRLSRCLRLQSQELQRPQSANSGESSTENGDKENSPVVEDDQPFGTPELLIMRQVPLSYDRKNGYSSRSSYANAKQLGMLEKSPTSRDSVLANPSDEAEKALVANVVGPNGDVIMEWPSDLCDRVFDLTEYENVEETKLENDANKKEKVVTTVADCIKKFCQMEQLEETEMWYCNRCKKHVRAWKQFHIYRAPPILIVHLKRFHYSASTHRRDKITSFIDFPLEGLDLTEMVTHYTEESKPVYDCYAVSNHYGNLGGGHYTAHILNDDGTWCYYDDSRVTTRVEVKEVVSEAAYVLYYRRRDVPLGQDIVEQNTTPSHMICEPVEDMTRDTSEISSNNSSSAAVADDDIDIDMAVDGSSRTGSLPVELMDADLGSSEADGFVPDKEDFPPLQ
jgi:ubiquitin carboxyl-terminal hydrolase 4/11/15